MSGARDDYSAVRLFTDAPWNGSRTPGFMKFKRDFQAGADAMFLHEDDWADALGQMTIVDRPYLFILSEALRAGPDQISFRSRAPFGAS